MNVCIGNENKKVKFTQIEGFSEMLSGITEKYDEKHIQRIHHDLLTNGGKKSEIEVDMVSLDTIDSLKNQKIDFISIDTEGNEFDIVSSINFDVLDIKSLVVENNYNDIRINKYLEAHGFELIFKLHCDEVYIYKKKFSIGISARILFWKLNSKWNRFSKKIKHQ